MSADIRDLTRRLDDLQRLDSRHRPDAERSRRPATPQMEIARSPALRNGPDDLQRATARLDDLIARRQVVESKRAELEQQLAALPEFADIVDNDERDEVYQQQRHLSLQLRNLRSGTLLRSPGETYEDIDYLNDRITECTRRRDGAQSLLDDLVRSAETLLAETPAAVLAETVTI